MMQFEPVAIEFVQGLDTDTDVKLKLPGKWDTLVNLTLEGGVLQRRDGHVAIETGITGNALIAQDDSLLVANGPAVSRVLTEPPVDTIAVWTQRAMAIPRKFHTLTTLADGRVLAVGGASDADALVVRDECEIYDPVAGTWSNTGSLVTARMCHAACLLADGTVLVSGGLSAEAYVESTEVYNPDTGTWTENDGAGGNLPAVLYDHQMAAVTGGAIACGGASEHAYAVKTTYKYTAATNSWAVTAPAGNMATARKYFSLVTLPSGLVLAVGGSPDAATVVVSCELYNPTTGRWTATGDLNVERCAAGCCLLSTGLVAATGGINWFDVSTGSVEGYTDTTETYSAASGVWTLGESLTVARSRHAALAMIGRTDVLIVGGVAVEDIKTAERGHPLTGWAVDSTCLYNHGGCAVPLAGNSALATGGAALDTGLPTDAEVLTASAPASSGGGVYRAARSTQPVSIGWVEVSAAPLKRSASRQDSPDIAFGNGYVCCVWRESSASVAVLLLDSVTGSVVIKETQLQSTGQSPRVVFSGDHFLIFWSLTGKIRGNSIQTVNGRPSLGSAIDIVSDAKILALTLLDACDLSTDTTPRALVAYKWNDATTSVMAAVATASLGVTTVAVAPAAVFAVANIAVARVLGLATLPLNGGTEVAIFCHAGASGVWGTVLASADLSASVAQASLGTSPSANTVSHITATLITPTAIHLFVDAVGGNGSAAGIKTIKYFAMTTALSSITTGTTIYSASYVETSGEINGPSGPWIAGKAFPDGRGNSILPVATMDDWGAAAIAPTLNPGLQNSLFFLEGTTGQVVASALLGKWGKTATDYIPTVCATAANGDGGYLMAAHARSAAILEEGVNATPSGLEMLTLTPDATNSRSQEIVKRTAFISGGSLTTYDGSTVGEQGFWLFPEGVGFAAGAKGAASALTVGVHYVVAVYEWVDNYGNRHQSAPSIPQAVTVIADQVITCVLPCLLLTEKNNVQIVPYLTVAGGVTLLRSALASGASRANDPTAISATVILQGLDETFAGNEALYTQPLQAGTALVNLPVGPAICVTEHQKRLIVAAGDRDGVYYFSQTAATEVGLQFNTNTLCGELPEGRITALASMDEKLLIFTNADAYAVLGSGPSTSGAGSTYSDPIGLGSDVGAVCFRSVLSMPTGVIFKSLKGWHLLGRDMLVRYIGGPVDRYDTLEVSSSALLDDRKEARFTLEDGRVLVFCYAAGEGGQWSTFLYRTAASTYYVAADSRWWPALGKWVTVSATDGLSKDTPGLYVDTLGAAQVPLAIDTTARTGFIHLGRLEGFQRVQWLYLTGTADELPTSSLSCAVDYDDVYGSAQGAYTWTANLALLTTVDPQSVDLRHKLRRQKCKSIAFTIADHPVLGVDYSGATKGLNKLQALGLMVGVKRGTNKLPAVQTVG